MSSEVKQRDAVLSLHGYRFAFYGRSGFGKTCYLAAMAQGAPGLPGNLTVERLPLTEETAADPALSKGDRWISTAVNALQENRVPPPNPAEDEPYPAIEFRVGSPQRGPSRVRLIDYSGELVDPSGLDNPEALARQLQEQLRGYDALVILAETPRIGESGRLAPELLRLREALSALHESNDVQHVYWPVMAIVFTKWDRQSQIDFDSPANERDKLRQFLEQNSEFRSLVDTCANAVSQQPDLDEVLQDVKSSAAVIEGNVAVFAVSAFGEAVRQDNQELPPADGLRCFGLLDPILWLAHRRDQLDLEELESRAEALQPEASLRRIRSVNSPTHTLRAETRRLERRIPAQSPLRPRLEMLRDRLVAIRRKEWLFSTGIAAALLLVLLGVSDLGWGMFVQHRFDQYASVAEDPKSESSELGQARRWFDRAARRYRGYLCGPSRDECRQQRDKIDRLVVERRWNEVKNASDPIQQGTLADKYLKDFPNAPNADKAHEYTRAMLVARNDQMLKKWMDRQKRVNAGQEISGRLRGLKDLEVDVEKGLPYPDVATVEQVSRRRDLLQNIRNLIDGIEHTEEWNGFVDGLEERMQRKDYASVIKRLLDWHPTDDRWRKLMARTLDEVGRGLDDVVKQTGYSVYKIEQAREKVQQAIRSLEHHESRLDSAGIDAVKLMRTWKTCLNVLDEKKDRSLYELFLQNRDRESCERYLQEAPLGTMKQVVMRYRTFLENQHKTWSDVQLSLELQIDKQYSAGWLESVGEYYFEKPVIGDYRPEYLPERGTASIASGGSKVISDGIPLGNVPADKRVEISLALWQDDLLLDNRAGEGKGTFSRDELRKGVTVELRSEGCPWVNKARLKIVKGAPAEPETPAWRGDALGDDS